MTNPLRVQRCGIFAGALAALVAAAATPAPAATVEHHRSFAGAGVGFAGCLRAADATRNASACVIAYSEPDGVHVEALAYDSTALTASSYFESVVAPSGALSVVTTSDGVPVTHLDVTLPRTGQVVVDVEPMSSGLQARASRAQVQCGMTMYVATDDGSPGISAPTYDVGTVNGVSAVNADNCSLYWITPSSGSWLTVAPTDESVTSPR